MGRLASSTVGQNMGWREPTLDIASDSEMQVEKLLFAITSVIWGLL